MFGIQTYVESDINTYPEYTPGSMPRLATAFSLNHTWLCRNSHLRLSKEQQL
jgi:hypothetical protein